MKDHDDVNTLPPPSQLKAFALGYDSAAVDLLWSDLLVAFGAHWHEKREFHADPYLDAMLYLEPTYARVYRFADTLLCYHPLHATEADARRTRAILEQGTRERPWDFEVWQEYGQFIAFLGPAYLKSATEAEKDAWRRDGALAMAKSVDLGAPGVGSLIASTMLGAIGGDGRRRSSRCSAYAVNYGRPGAAGGDRRASCRGCSASAAQRRHRARHADHRVELEERVVVPHHERVSAPRSAR